MLISINFKSLSVAVSALVLSTSVSAASIVLDFPSEDSIVTSGSNTSTLGVGGGGRYFRFGDTITETFIDTGLSSATSSNWVFSMSDFTSAGVTNIFDVKINGSTIGSFSFTSDGDSSDSLFFDLTFEHDLITGDDFTLDITATSTVYSGGGAYNWLPGGSVTLISSVPVPAALWLFGSGLIGLIGVARRKKA